MKKSKRSTGLEEHGLDSSGELGLDSDDDDDEIIELEDIVEMPAGSFDDDEIVDQDVEILDAEEDADFDLPGKTRGTQDEPHTNGLIDELSAWRDEAAHAGPGTFEQPVGEPAGRPEPSIEEPVKDEEDPLEALIAAERKKLGIGAEAAPSGPADILLPLEEDAGEEDLDAFVMTEPETGEITIPEAPDPAPEPAAIEEPPAPAAVSAPPQVQEPPHPASHSLDFEDIISPGVDIQISANLNTYIDQLIGGVEAKLVDTIRTLVDERLPDIVREIIREEIDKIKAGE